MAELILILVEGVLIISVIIIIIFRYLTRIKWVLHILYKLFLTILTILNKSIENPFAIEADLEGKNQEDIIPDFFDKAYLAYSSYRRSSNTRSNRFNNIDIYYNNLQKMFPKLKSSFKFKKFFYMISCTPQELYILITNIKKYFSFDKYLSLDKDLILTRNTGLLLRRNFIPAYIEKLRVQKINLSKISKEEFKEKLSAHNKWRTSSEVNNEEKGNFEYNDLESVDIKNEDLSEANFEGANLYKQNFSGTKIDKVNFKYAFLALATFSNHSFDNTDFTKANLTFANFFEADLRHAKLEEAILNNARLGRAKLQGVNLRNAKLRDANLQETDLSGADLSGADLTNANLLDTNLTNTNLTNVKGLNFDNNQTYRTKLSSGSKDHWSVLRRNYTGYTFVFNLLLLILFILPYVLKTIFWLSINETQKLLQTTVTEVMPFVLKLQENNLHKSEQIRKKLDNLVLHNPVNKQLSDMVDNIKVSIDESNKELDNKFSKLSDSLNLLEKELKQPHGLLKDVPSLTPSTDILKDNEKEISKQALVSAVNKLKQDILEINEQINNKKNKLNRYMVELVKLDPSNNLLLKATDELKQDIDESLELSHKLVEEVNQITPCLSPKCEQYNIFGLLMGLDKPLSDRLIIWFLIYYNIVRAMLTGTVGPLREEELRSGYSPHKKEYIYLYYLHHINHRLAILALLFAIWHLGHILIEPVFIPLKYSN